MKHRLGVLIVVASFLGACAQPGTGMYRPDLNDDTVARVSPGQSGPEVSALLGAPYRRMRFDNLKATAWDYRFRDTWGYWVDLSVMMGDDGRVVNKVLVRIDPPDKD
jgi:hypothetical protein